jgi:hypothetical protein
MRIARYGSRYWSVVGPDGSLVCVTLYKRGALEVVRLLEQAAQTIETMRRELAKQIHQ